MAEVLSLSFARSQRMGSHDAAGKLHLVTSIRQDPGAGLLASNAGGDRLRSARLVALVCLCALPVLACVARCGGQP